MFILAGLAALLIVFLWAERLSVERRLCALKLRAAVTGTRGKSSVTRLLHAALRESGVRTIGKTTGSAALVLLPDGSERELPRFGPPSILEHKSVLRLAGRVKAEALVSEMMSIRPECLRVESRKLVRPAVLVITNVRVDHREEQGRTREAVARSLAEAIPPGGTVIVPDEDFFPVFAERAAEAGARLIRVPAEADATSSGASKNPTVEFDQNVRLALAAAERLGVSREAALKGMAGGRPDPGGLRFFRVGAGEPPRPWLFVSAFAANEPESSMMALNLARKAAPFPGGAKAAVLNLRDDRGDRTLQWLAAARDGFFREFDAVALVGSRAVSALRRQARVLENSQETGATKFAVVSATSPEAVTASMIAAPGFERGGVLVGLGNMGGLGRRLAEHWERMAARPGRMEQSRA